MDDYKILSTESYEDVKKIINDINFKYYHDYNLFLEDTEEGYKIMGYPKNQPVIYPIFLHSIRVSR